MPLWLWLLLVVSMACLFCWYISPSRNSKSTKGQRIVALTWILFRRIISFIAAIFGVFVIYILCKSTGSITEKIFGSVMITCLSVFFIYVGVVGQGWNQNALSDDLSLYAKVKKKYGIRW
ncbi:MAG: hypothetical protein ACI9ES_003029 [Oceanospirillaceae bacterium]|jgi:hypothetical protein